ncbi:LpxL/LpxP family Kdo(2)-lipid IV(A) lauroyl/palmitoleoyl acyltransferase [Shewanella sp. VB17]|uniref:LpxL/LpxP family Kdo(2)-lipid IV(A) lauroyl/palmitoleoyl acyltransferase n=1 Tax=Shewanella sp. VB17 TaxID=2739432 RepID=UPI001564533C|nr:LpxL/LpxP family Kdo(2)-lipid IV(A) lauroyl/palmitoleoyl acyltransferase [Shewanella sp. VB17]NRD71980.1 LpxL/LpxP family Kdo(2)-lipid IV(A) lauroyl/palmitoleoyl acyltransferase [Shewanella sp. VB17]
MNPVPYPSFSIQLLAIKYWPIWFAFATLALIVNVLPYFLLRRLGYAIGLFAMPLLKSRSNVAKCNLKLCFPEYSEYQCTALVKKNFQYTGMALIETGMAWFWPEWRVRRISSVIGKEKLLKQEKNGRGVLLLSSHHLNLEMTARIFSQFTKGYAVYRPNSNPVYEFIQHRGRTRSGHKMIDRKDIKSMLKVLKKGDLLWYLADHDYGPKNSVFAPFFAVAKAASTTGSSVLIDATRCAVISAVTVVKNSHYTLHIGNDLSKQIERRNPVSTASIVNRELEGMINRDIPAWMWLHKRFKTRPEGLENVYSKNLTLTTSRLPGDIAEVE